MYCVTTYKKGKHPVFMQSKQIDPGVYQRADRYGHSG